MSLNFLPLLTALLPALAINFCYLLAASQGHVPWCIPYLEGCTSISATGRQAPESYLFRALIIPTAVLLVFYWRLSHILVICKNGLLIVSPCGEPGIVV